MEPTPLDGSERFAIVVAEWNRSITAKLLEGAQSTLAEVGVSDSQVDVAWVPGAWEIPLVAQRFAQSGNYAAVICLGAVIRGETSHDQHINRAVSLSLQQIALASDLPMLFGSADLRNHGTGDSPLRRQRGQQGGRVCRGCTPMVALLKNCPPA